MDVDPVGDLSDPRLSPAEYGAEVADVDTVEPDDEAAVEDMPVVVREDDEVVDGELASIEFLDRFR